MNKYQIVEIAGNFNHAGSKATADIAQIASNIGFEEIKVRMRSQKDGTIGKIIRQIGYYIDWEECYKKVKNNSVVILQHPFHYNQITRVKTLKKLKNKKKVKYISVVHDVEELRAFRYSEYYAEEFEVMLQLSDVIIVHNDVMKRWFISKGVNEDKLISLEIFDYLQEHVSSKEVGFEKSITIAGNLDTTKCAYIGQLGELKGIKIHLYGPNFDTKMDQFDNVEYHGSFPVNEIPDRLKCGFGLVWDGNSIDGCKGQSGQYLRYNNPHKLSLYLSSGLPVVIWSKAAEGDFVKRNNVGITVENLYELPHVLDNMTEEKYRELAKNAFSLGKNLRIGKYGETALVKAMEIIENKKMGAC